MSEEPQVRFLGDVERLALKPDDVLVLRTSIPLTRETTERIRDHIASIVGQDRKVLILEHGMEVGVLAPEPA